jgi:hypothetical protein
LCRQTRRSIDTLQRLEWKENCRQFVPTSKRSVSVYLVRVWEPWSESWWVPWSVPWSVPWLGPWSESWLVGALVGTLVGAFVVAWAIDWLIDEATSKEARTRIMVCFRLLNLACKRNVRIRAIVHVAPMDKSLTCMKTIKGKGNKQRQ